jgi:hypothetical protein
MIEICHDCGVKEGQIHKRGCDMERCPKCGGQRIICNCNARGLKPIPYIVWPNICSRCGKLWPDILEAMLLDKEWLGLVGPAERHAILCKPCLNVIRRLMGKTRFYAGVAQSGRAPSS